MAKNNDNKAAHGVTRRDVIKGVGAGAAGLALTRTGSAQSGEVQGSDGARESQAIESVAKPDGHESRATPDGTDEVLGFISPTYAIPFKIPRV
jgi:hypothetical protein